jgi:hypothetical protein
VTFSIFSFDAGAAPPDPRDELRGSALQAMKEGRFADARDVWLRLWELERSRVAACNVGELSLRIGDMPRAAEFLTTCVQGGAKEEPDAAARARDEEHVLSLARARQAVGALSFRAAEGAEITVDDRPVGRAPLDREVFVAPGSHRVRAELGEESGEVAVEVAAGAARRVVVPLEAPARPPPPAPAPVPMPPSPERARGWIVATGIAASASLLAAGAGLLIASSAQEGKGEEQVARPNGCFFPVSGCAGARDTFRAADAYHAAGMGALLAGAALAGGTLTYSLLPRSNAAKIGVRGGGMVVETTW